MRRKRALWGGRAVSVLIAAFVGYLVGGWNPPASHNRQLSAAQMIALRFPQDSADEAISSVMPVMAAGDAQTDQAQGSLFNPQPMAPQAPVAQASMTTGAASAGTPVATLQMAALEQPAPAPIALTTAPRAVAAQSNAAKSAVAAVPARQSIAAAAQASVARLAAAAHRNVNERPGFVLNDAQIASIKQRLHMTPDQEEMWPAVEAALRNLAYTRARDARSKGGATAAQIAESDPYSPEVQDLKSAAIPLIMSFNSEQKDEVRNLAHVMGLDQLASQF